MCKRYYLAYGSNLNIPQMRHRCPTAKVVGTAEIRDYELLFKGCGSPGETSTKSKHRPRRQPRRKTGYYLTIEPKKGAKVPVAVWEVKQGDEANLDVYEGFPRFYYKKDMQIKCRYLKSGKTRTISAFVYIMHEDRQLGVPSAYYVNTCLDGYDSFGFDSEYIYKAIEKSLRTTKGVKK